ncbi:response regulator transcription factor [Marinoscillum sp.]|uniref:response regulator transcription factor n=1 Tax=Marinoscillum sp. TaxID=2024838 RepID=UPI003BA964FD
MSEPRILLAEDDPNLSFVIEDHLISEGFTVVAAANGHEALRHFRNQSVDLCLIDVMMPKMDGFSLATEIRKVNDLVPILFLTARSMEQDRLKGFEIGGDDYITKPFSIAELTQRIRVFLRRSVTATGASEKKLALGALRFDELNLLVIGPQSTAQLTQMEADLLKLLLQHRNQLVKRETILVEIWGENDYFKGRSLDVFISRLRKYLKEDPDLEIRNHHGVGFSLVDRNFSG